MQMYTRAYVAIHSSRQDDDKHDARRAKSTSSPNHLLLRSYEHNYGLQEDHDKYHDHNSNSCNLGMMSYEWASCS